MRRAIRCAWLAMLVGSTAGCPGRYVEVGPGGVVASSRQTGWHRKKVVTRQEPETLLAGDGTVCRVSPERFKATKIGTVVYCDWQ